ncbi:MAG: aldehyde ferredoxin oxidoreductase N-terminal domain-containing protein, partial [Chloroflexota bacterium]|nr:aldehyde ferredoxin oxidoreductase N-terminal domain-containing protein [Chloroflexota bacterium]
MKARMLRVNLDNRQIGTQEVDESALRSYIGGSGLGAKVLWEETTATTEAFSPQNPLVFAIGPLTGLAPQTGRYSVSAISPATDAWGEAHSGGLWGKELRWTGWWGLIIRGRAPQPVYLYVKDDRAELRDASHLWGKDTYQTSDLLRKETEERASVACIGMAGERGARVAGIVNDGWDGRFAARGGLGAVMGSKNLKAIVLRGTRKPQVADGAALKESTQPVIRYLTENRLRAAPARLEMLGKGRKGAQDTGNLPVRNWSRGRF